MKTKSATEFDSPWKDMPEELEKQFDDFVEKHEEGRKMKYVPDR